MAHKLDRTYGRWEFRARTDKGRGFGSAILLWPESERFPQDGEIDIMEVPSETRDRAHFIVHFAGPGGSDKVYGSYAEDDFSQWHTFAVDWLPDRIVYYVDGVERFRVTDRNIIPDKPMHLAMQFDQGPKKDWIPRARTRPLRRRSPCRSTGCASTRRRPGPEPELSDPCGRTGCRC